MNKVWVLAEAFEGKPLPIVLERLAKARELGGSIEAVAWGTDVASYAEELGKHGVTKIYNVGDIGQALPGVPVGAAIANQVQQGNGPDALLIGMTYDGRDIAGRLSAKLERPVLTNVVNLSGGDKPTSDHAIFGGTQIVKASFTGETPYIFVIRPKSFAAEESGGGTPEVVDIEVPDTGATNAAKIENRHVEEHTGPKLDEAAVVVSGGRGLGEAEKYSMIEDLA